MLLIIITLSIFYSTVIYVACSISKTQYIEILYRLPLISFNILLLTIFTSFMLYTIGDCFSIRLPIIQTFFIQFLLYLWLDDLWFYTFHRFMHANPWVLRKIHSIHHTVKQPIAFDFIYVHPLEWMGGAMGMCIASIMIYQWFGTINAYVFWTYIGFRTMHELFIHSGKHSKVLQYLPLFLTNTAHALHHRHASGNYASMLNYLDILFHTNLCD